jgi:hypothetical protein
VWTAVHKAKRVILLTSAPLLFGRNILFLVSKGRCGQRRRKSAYNKVARKTPRKLCSKFVRSSTSIQPLTPVKAEFGAILKETLLKSTGASIKTRARVLLPRAIVIWQQGDFVETAIREYVLRPSML